MTILTGKKSTLIKENKTYKILSKTGKVIFFIAGKFIGANKEALYQFLKFEDQKKPYITPTYK